jgi:hypothetical protein
VQRREPELGGLRHDVRPLRAGADPGDAPLGIALDAAQAVGPEQDHVVHVPQRLGVVTRALRSDLEPLCLGEADDLRHIARRLGQRDELRVLGEREVVRLRGRIPARLAGSDDRTPHTLLQTASCAFGLDDDGHGWLLLESGCDFTERRICRRRTRGSGGHQPPEVRRTALAHARWACHAKKAGKCGKSFAHLLDLRALAA